VINLSLLTKKQSRQKFTGRMVPEHTMLSHMQHQQSTL